jgi:single-stranded-DNA-specific exonuclease
LRPHWKLPDRRTDQYGLDLAMAARLMAEFHPDLLICLDNGTNCADAISFLRRNDVDTIIVDHHPVTTMAADAIAIVNPKAHPQAASGDWAELCAAGLTLLLCHHLTGAWGCQDKWDFDTAAMLAGIGTMADAVRLSGTNRALVKRSLVLLNSPSVLERCVGLKALVPSDGQRISQRRVQFEIVPPLNALGRLDSPAPGVELLTTADATKARQIGGRCQTLNEQRKTIQKQIVEQAVAQGRQLIEQKPSSPVLILAHPDWLPGVVGPAASRVVDQLARSAILLGLDSGPNRWKGSGRAFNSDHLGAWLQSAKALGVVERGGGHAAAVGVALRSEQIEQLRVVAPHLPMPQTADHEAEHEVIGDVGELTPSEWLSVFELLEPFGAGNPAPLLQMNKAKLIAEPDDLLVRATGAVWAVKGSFRTTTGALSAVWTDVPQAFRLWFSGSIHDLELELTVKLFNGRPYYNWTVIRCSPAVPV